MEQKIKELIESLQKEKETALDAEYNENVHPLSREWAKGKVVAFSFCMQELRKILNENCVPKGN
jgi:hypothetical protein